MTLAPLEAATKAAQSIKDFPSNAEKVSINVARGDDLMLHEVWDGVKLLTSQLEGSSFESSSLCHTSNFPLENCGIAVVADAGDSSSELYWNGGKWWTVLEEALKTAL